MQKSTFMVLKRDFDHHQQEGSEFPAREPKRHHGFASIARDVMKEQSVQEFVLELEPVIRRWVREEVERVVTSCLSSRSFCDHDASSESRAWRLHFEGEIPPTLFTGSNIGTRDNRPVRIVLRDAVSKEVIADGPLSSVRVRIVPLDGDFNPEEKGEWTDEEFRQKVIREREGKRPLLAGNLAVQLRDGVGHLSDVCFTDNSSWIRCRKFRLGASVQTALGDAKVREGVSKEFKVKDHRGESYKKHHPPAMDDEVWRLEKIAKDGVAHRRLTQHGVNTVREFLWLYMTNPTFLRKVLNDGVFSEKKWRTITDHAKSCDLDEDELYVYQAAGGLGGIVFNSMFKAVGAFLGDEYHPSLDDLNIVQKQKVQNLKQIAYRNREQWVRVDSQTLFGFSSFISPIQQDQAEVQMVADHGSTSRSYSYDVEENDQLEVSDRMKQLSSTFRNSFSLTDAICGGYAWYPTDSLGHNYSYADSAVHAGTAFAAPFDQEGLQTVPGNRKPRVRWCKLRAIVKWQILVKQKWLLNRWQNFLPVDF